MDDPLVAMRAALDGRQAAIFTMMPGVIDSYNAGTMTAKVQPAIQGNIPQFDGTVKPTNLPLLINCPVQFPGGGAFTFTFPLTQGDEVLILWAMRCVDAWWQSGGVQPQAEFRMHDISDGFCIPKVWSQKKKLSNVSATKAQLRNADQTVMMEMDASGFKFTGPVTLVNDSVADGSFLATGAVEAGVGGADHVTLQHHTHPANGSPPTPGT